MWSLSCRGEDLPCVDSIMQVMGALKKGDKADGGVTLILERPL